MGRVAATLKSAEAKRARFAVGAAVAACALAVTGFNGSVFVGVVAGYGAVGLAVGSVLARRPKVFAGALLSAAVAWFCSATYQRQLDTLHLAAEPAIEMLEGFYSEHGRYPIAFGPDADDVSILMPKCISWRERRAMYLSGSGDGASFSILCVTFGYMKHSYDSATGEWRSWD